MARSDPYRITQLFFSQQEFIMLSLKVYPEAFMKYIDTDVKSCTCDTFKSNNFCRHLFKCDENLDNDFNEIDHLSNDIEVNLSFENSSHSSEKDGESSFDPNIWENITKYVTLNPISSTVN